MTISELIKQLEVFKAEHGDLKVYYWGQDPFDFSPREEAVTMIDKDINERNEDVVFIF